MDDKDRDRDRDGAGPVAHSRKYIKSYSLHTLLLVVFFFCTTTTNASSPFSVLRSPFSTLRGLSLTVDFGATKVSDFHANFYNGNPDNANTLARILYSETYGNRIWNTLTEQNLISSSVANYNQITVAEYGDMYYKIAFRLGMGLRYDFDPSNWAWQIRFDYSKLHAAGLVLLNSGHNTAYLTNQNAYVNCPTSGTEERIFIDLGIIRKFKLHNGLDLELSLGGDINNTKVQNSDILIGGISYSILDVWRGASPSSYTGTYEYINQGGIGYGAYASIALGFTLPVGTAMSLAYNFSYCKTNLEGYSSFAPQHALSLVVALNNFSFFD